MKVLSRFIGVGVVNTLLGLTVIFAALHLGAGDYIANAAGYVAGLIASFGLHRKFTFELSGPPRLHEGLRFMITAGIAFCCNLAVLHIGRTIGMGGTMILQLPAMAAYSLAFYLLSSMFVFRQSGRHRETA